MLVSREEEEKLNHHRLGALPPACSLDPGRSLESGRGLDLTVEGLGLSLQAPELLLDEVGQGLPHLQLKAKV